MQKPLFALAAAFALAFSLLIVASTTVSATAFTVSPWAYACGQTVYSNPATATDLACAGEGTSGSAIAVYGAGNLTVSKTGPLSGDLASGATISGLVHLTAASWDIGGYCGAGAPRLNVVTSDGKTHFFGCSANRQGTSTHVVFDLTAAGDGSGNGGVAATDVITSIDIVMDEPGQATIGNMSFTGTPTPTPTATPNPSPAATPHPTVVPVLAQTGSGTGEDGFIMTIGLLIVVAIALVGIGVFTLVRGKI